MPLYYFANVKKFLNKETISNEINCDKARQKESKQSKIKKQPHPTPKYRSQVSEGGTCCCKAHLGNNSNSMDSQPCASA